MDATSKSYPDWIEVDFNGAKTIDQVGVFTVQDDALNPSEPTESMTFEKNGIVDFQIQYWNGLAWQTVSGGNITGNNLVWKKLNFAQITTSKIRVNVTNSVDGSSRVTELEAWGPSPGTSYAYDAAGSVTNDGVHSYTYDSENRLASVDSGTTATYAYDHQNRRYKKTVGSTVTHYIWEGSQVMAEHNGSTGAVLVDYINGAGRMLAKVESSTTSYFLSDRLSARMTLNTSGAVVGRQAHLPFGEDFGESGTQEKHHLTSYERDTETGTDYAVNRQHSQSLGRFLRVDPVKGSISSPQSLNGYAYARNNPVNLIDPRGLEVTCLWDGYWVCFGDASEDLPRDQNNDDMKVVDDSPDETDDPDDGMLDQYDYCKTVAFGASSMAGKLLVPTAQATKLAMKASQGDSNMAAMIAAIWGKESNFNSRPTGDHGPMQLTSWPLNNYPDAILPGAYDQHDRLPGNQIAFEGSVRANVWTGANILRHLFSEHNGNWSKMAEWYHGNARELTKEQNDERRRRYAADVMSALPQFQQFFKCMNTQLPH